MLPQVRIHDYNGPYDRKMLEEARQSLLQIIDGQDTIIWKRIRMKTGICENGERHVNPGWGEASTAFSHAHLPDISLNNVNQNQNLKVASMFCSPVREVSRIGHSQSSAAATSQLTVGSGNNETSFVILH